MRKVFVNYWGLVAVLILSFWAVLPFFTPGFFPIHDDTQVVRVQQMTQALTDGYFPVRWVKDLGYGYGYPLFNFYAPLPYYFGGMLGALGVDLLTSTKTMMVVGILLSGLFMYLLARQFWGELGGVIGGLFYMYAPYHAVDIYVRGAVGEFWAYAFIPLMFLGLFKLQKELLRCVIVGAIGFAGIILSHNLTAMMVIPFLAITILLHCYIVYKKKQLSTIYYLLSTILLGLGLSAFYWLPALTELPYTNVISQIGGGADFRDHFVCLQQLWNSPWGFGGSAPECIVDGLSFKVGKLHLIVSLIAFLIGIYLWSKDKVRAILILSSICYLLLSIFMMLEISKPIWELITPMAFLQYPWRFLIFASFFSSLLAGAIIWFFHYYHYYDTALYHSGKILLLILLLLFNAKLFQPQTILQKTEKDYINENNIKWMTSKISDEYMPKNFAKPMFEVGMVKRRVSVGEIKVDKTQELVFGTTEASGRTIHVNIAPYPAWQTFVDGIPTSYIARNDGIEILVPKGEHEVRLAFLSTRVEKLGNLISIISVLGLFGAILLELRWKRFRSFQSSFLSGMRKITSKR